MCRWNRRACEEDGNATNNAEVHSCIHVIDLPPTYEAATRQNNEYPKVSSPSLITKPPPSYDEIAAKMMKNLEGGENSSTATVQHI